MGRPRLVDDLDAEVVPRQGVQDPVAVRGIPVADPDPDLCRGERPNRLADVERDGFGARGDPRVDHLSIPNDGDARLPARIDANEQLAPERFPLEDLDRLRNRRIDVVHRDDVPGPDPFGLGRRSQDGPDGVRNSTSEGEAHERQVASLQCGDQVVVEAEILREQAEDLAHLQPRKPDRDR